jgi:WD40 repeat protein
MSRRFIPISALGAALFGLTACEPWFAQQSPSGEAAEAAPVASTAQAQEPEPAPATNVDIGKPLYGAAQVPDLSAPVPSRPGEVTIDPIIVPECRLSVIESEEVPAQRDGLVIDFIGTETKPGEVVPEDRQIVVPDAEGKNKVYRELREGDRVEPGQLMAILDEKLDRAEYETKEAKLKAALADAVAAAKTRDETRERWISAQRLFNSRALSEEDLRMAKLTWDNKTYEAVSKEQAANVAKVETNAAKILLEMHQVRSKIAGIIKTIHKHPGESVKNGETVFTVRNLSRLRAEGLVDAQHRDRIRPGMRATIEPSVAESPQQTLVGHLAEVTGVAVSKDNNPVSGCEDGSLIVWNRSTRQPARVFHLPSGIAVRSLACTPTAASWNLCLVGGSDGIGRIYDLASSGEKPARQLEGEHKGALDSVAFSADGKICATGNEDHSITIWDTASGKEKYNFQAHRGQVSSVQFTPLCELVSAGRDNTIKIWALGEQGARQIPVPFLNRSGDVAALGVSPDGHRVLFDQGKMLRVLSIPQGLTEGVLQNAGTPSNFTSFAMFSPDGRVILTANAAEGRLQMWRPPSGPNHRTYVVRELASSDRSPVITCAAFSPDGTFVVTGGKDRQVLVWTVPSVSEIEKEIAAEVTLFESGIESSTGQCRVTADFANRDGRLLPGGTVTMAVHPPE